MDNLTPVARHTDQHGLGPMWMPTWGCNPLNAGHPSSRLTINVPKGLGEGATPTWAAVLPVCSAACCTPGAVSTSPFPWPRGEWATQCTPCSAIWDYWDSSIMEEVCALQNSNTVRL